MNKNFGLIVLLVFTGLTSAAENNKYNVLFIAVDDLRPELGCYGVSHAQSPNIDAFAKEACLFDRHYVQVPTCGASRYSLLTGRSPLKSGALNNAAAYQGKTKLKTGLNTAQTFPEMFKRSGYKTACIGKISHSPDGRIFSYSGKGDGQHELPNTWDELPTPFGKWQRGWGTFFAYEGGRHREDGQGNKDLMEFTAKKDTDLPDGMMAETAIQQLRKWKDKRFFIGLGFYKPHLPLVATKKDWDAFEGVDIPNPVNTVKPQSSNWHKSGEFYKYNAPFKKGIPLKQDALTKSRRAYLACVRYVDRQIGKVLKELKVLGLDKNTIVVIWGDHGWFLGDMQTWGKHSAFEEANRSVFIIKTPGNKPQRSSALVESLDIFPTLAELCQPKDKALSHSLDGKSLKSLIEGKSQSVRQAARSYWKKKVSIRTNTHRLIIDNNGKNAELYKMDSVYTDGNNIAKENPELIQKIKELWIKE